MEDRRRGFAAVIVVLLAAFLLVAGVVGVSSWRRGEKPELPGVFKPALQSDRRKLLALGASTTKANNLSTKMVGDNPEYSFATGTKVESFYLYLKGKGESLEAVNLAESGANSEKVLTHQLPNAISMQPKYAVVDIVADVFEEVAPTKLKQNLGEVITQLKVGDTVVLVGTYPNLARMRQAGYSACSQDKLRIGVDKATEEKIRIFNEAIKETAQSYGAVVVDNFGVLGPDEVSDYDCLHPNIEGQKKLAKNWIETWEREVSR